jgi:hypothetical protein
MEHFDLFEANFKVSSGLCLPHLRLALRQPASREAANALAYAQRDIWQRLKTELETFQRKSDINHAHETRGEEGDSWVRAIGLLAGSPAALPDRARS